MHNIITYIKKSEIVEKASKGLSHFSLYMLLYYAYPLLAFSTISLFFSDFKKTTSWDSLESKWGVCVYIYIYTCYYIMHIPCLLSQLSHFSFQISKKRHHDFDILNTLKNYAVIFFFLYNCVFFSFYKVYKIKGILIYLTCHQLQDN